jgi:hypothetical protein
MSLAETQRLLGLRRFIMYIRRQRLSVGDASSEGTIGAVLQSVRPEHFRTMWPEVGVAGDGSGVTQRPATETEFSAEIRQLLQGLIDKGELT